MRDAASWTREPEYERFLHVRVFRPENIEQRELRCNLTFGTQTHKTDILDPPPPPPPPEEEDPPSPVKSTTPDGRPARPMRGRGRGRGTARGRGGRPGAARGGHSTEQLRDERKPEGVK